MAEGVPAEFIEVATQKLTAINAAYEEITATRRVLKRVLQLKLFSQRTTSRCFWSGSVDRIGLPDAHFHI